MDDIMDNVQHVMSEERGGRERCDMDAQAPTISSSEVLAGLVEIIGQRWTAWDTARAEAEAALTKRR